VVVGYILYTDWMRAQARTEADEHTNIFNRFTSQASNEHASAGAANGLTGIHKKLAARPPLHAVVRRPLRY